MNSIIRHYMIIDNSLAAPHNAVAAEVFRLAQQGYMSICLDGTSVKLTRTDMKASQLKRESELLLHALFGFTDKPGTVKHINDKSPVPIAQSLAIIADTQMLKEGFTQEINSHKLRVILHSGYAAAAMAMLTILMWPLGHASLWFLWLILAALGWLVFTIFYVDPAANKGYKFTKSGKELVKEAKKARRRGTRKNAKGYEVFDIDLPFELLWLGNNSAYFALSVSKGVFDRKPEWYNEDWPNDQLLIKDRFDRLFRILAMAFSQPYSNYESLQDTLDIETFVTLKDTLDFLPADPANNVAS